MARWAVKLESVLKYDEGGAGTTMFEHTSIPITMHFECDTPEEAEALAIECVEIEAKVAPYTGDDEEWCGSDL